MALNYVEQNSSGSDEETQRIRAEEFARRNNIQPSMAEYHASPHCKFRRLNGTFRGRQGVCHYRHCICGQYPDQAALEREVAGSEAGVEFHTSRECRWKRTGSGRIVRFCFCRHAVVPQRQSDLSMVSPGY